MRRFKSSVIAGLVAVPFVLQGADTQPVANALRLRAGTAVVLRFANDLSSSAAQVNDRVEFRVVHEVRVGETAVIPKDSFAWGVVREAAPRSRMARPGKLAINIRSACTADGQAAPLRAVERPGASATKNDRGPGLGDTLLAFPAWPVMLFLYGKERKIESGTEVTAYTDREVIIDPAALGRRAASSCAGGPEAPIPAAAVTCAAMVRSDPDGAEIEVDGKYVGNTPSRLRLAPGDHEVVVKAAGRRPWRRMVMATAGAEISISAVLPSEVTIPASRADVAGGSK